MCMIPSKIYLPSTYPDCSGEISMGRRGFSLFAITLEMILYITLQSAIGRNLSGLSASSSFGIRAMKVVLSKGSSQ